MSKISTLINSLTTSNEIRGGVFALFKGREIMSAGAIGIGRGDMPLSINSYARVASISKLATALCFLKLAQAGKVSLDTDISHQIGFRLRNPNFANQIITPRMVLSHTSSVRDGDNYVGRIGETLESFFVSGAKNWDNGVHWAPKPIGYFAYSNLGMGLIAQIIERATGDRFDIAVQKILFEPIGVECGFNWSGVGDDAVKTSTPLFRRANNGNQWLVQTDENPINSVRPVHFHVEGKTLVDYVIGTNGLVFSPQGGLRANIIHLVRIAQVYSGQIPFLAAQTITNILAAQWNFDGTNGEGEIENGAHSGAFLSFGTGIHRLTNTVGCPIRGLKADLFGHYGQAYGLLGGLWLDPKSTKGFAWFINGSPQNPQNGAQSGVTRVEELIMQAAAEDIGLVE